MLNITQLGNFCHFLLWGMAEGKGKVRPVWKFPKLKSLCPWGWVIVPFSEGGQSIPLGCPRGLAWISVEQVQGNGSVHTLNGHSCSLQLGLTVFVRGPRKRSTLVAELEMRPHVVWYPVQCLNQQTVLFPHFSHHQPLFLSIVYTSESFSYITKASVKYLDAEEFKFWGMIVSFLCIIVVILVFMSSVVFLLEAHCELLLINSQ